MVTRGSSTSSRSQTKFHASSWQAGDSGIVSRSRTRTVYHPARQWEEAIMPAFTRRMVAIGLATTALARPAFAQSTATPPSVISNPPRQWGRHAPPDIYPDPDIVVIDPSFEQYLLGITAIHRVATGFLWCEGPAWS